MVLSHGFWWRVLTPRMLMYKSTIDDTNWAEFSLTFKFKTCFMCCKLVFPYTTGPRHLNLGSFLVLEPLADSLRGYAAVGSVTVCNLEAEGWELSRWGEVTDALRPGSFFWNQAPSPPHVMQSVWDTQRSSHMGWSKRMGKRIDKQ